MPDPTFASALPFAALTPAIRAFRPFLPAKDFATSLRFYEALGFEAALLGEGLAQLNLGPHQFLLQKHYVKDWAENFMMHVLVEDVQTWWEAVRTLDLEALGGRRADPPRREPWGLTVLYLFDPAGVLWHFAQPID